MVRLCRSTMVVFSETFFFLAVSYNFVLYRLMIILASCIESRFLCELYRNITLTTSVVIFVLRVADFNFAYGSLNNELTKKISI